MARFDESKREVLLLILNFVLLLAEFALYKHPKWFFFPTLQLVEQLSRAHEAYEGEKLKGQKLACVCTDLQHQLEDQRKGTIRVQN